MHLEPIKTFANVKAHEDFESNAQDIALRKKKYYTLLQMSASNWLGKFMAVAQRHRRKSMAASVF